MANRLFCTFWVGDLFFGVEVERVQEVIRFQEITRVPVAPPEVSGLINLRGQIVTAIDLRKRLGIEPRPEGEDPMNVVLREEDGVVSLLVDEIGDVLEVPDSLREPPPNTVDEVAREVIREVYKLTGQLLLVLDSESAMKFSAAS